MFSEAGVLGLADVHTAMSVCRIGREPNELVQLALALTVRALRAGSVCIDLKTVHTTVFEEWEAAIDASALPWPAAEEWQEACDRSPLVSIGPNGPPGRPLRHAHGLLYLERYWRQEELVRVQLTDRRASPPPLVDRPRLAAALDRLFDRKGLEEGEPDRQRLAAAVGALGRVSVLAGGPGTGKTTTVARLLALLRDQPGEPVRIALAAPTGKAAARLEEAVRSASLHLGTQDQERLGSLTSATLHRLLGWQPGRRGRFKHNARNHLPYDVVVVDEMSMVSLTMMARLLEAVRPTARLVLVGDPDQLSSVEAGAVLADIAAATAASELVHTGASEPVHPAAAGISDAPLDGEEVPTNGVVQLTHTWRFAGAIGELARAVRASDADAAIDILRSGASDLTFSEIDVESAMPGGLDNLSLQTTSAARRLLDAGRAGDVGGALSALDEHRLLCAHRRGPYGVARWTLEIERWLAAAIPGYGEDGEWYAGRPLLVTANDYELGLYNGDTGVVVETDRGIRAAFARGGEPVLLSPARLDAVQTVHAMTVHRAQGSQFRSVSFIVPPPDSALLTRELLYTGLTRATEQVQVFGSEEAIRRAIMRSANRASGLRGRL
ncbi:MAG TPA: exodeoxyribonuclease V subunit alpha [Dermatophilaceae bacterium]|nr:exodeoxyribonuclease V subunit alpha [Dermatophilaceae bacterium]